jgi:chain length determinant protein EpsF
MAVAGAITWTTPKTYVATASVLLDVKNADPIAGMVSPSMATPAFLVTQVDILKSKRVGMKVIRNLRLQDSDEMRQRWKKETKATGDFRGWLATLLQNGMEARPSRGSNVIFVSYKGTDPQFVATVANGFVQAYLETVLELRTDPAKSSKDFFDANTKSARTALESAQARVSDYQKSQDLLVTDERLDVETSRLNELSNQLVLVQSALADSSSRQAAATSQGDRSPDVMANPLVASLKADLIKQQTTMEQLSIRLGESHPSVQEQRTGIEDTSRKLDAEIRRVTSSVGVGNTVNLSRVAQVKSSLEAQRLKVMKLKAIRDEAAILQRDVDNAQRAYSSNLESQANQANVASLETAVAPSTPDLPRVGTSMALGALVAMVLAIAMALLVEVWDRRFRIPEEAEWLLQQPVLGHMPSFRKLIKDSAKSGSAVHKSSPVLLALNAKT